MDNRIGEMQAFMRVVESGSFSEAARQLRMTPSTVSKLIARIESRLGVRLIERSTRRLSLTQEGRIYFERSQAMMAELADMEQELSQGASHARGTVRINASVAFGKYGIEPLLPDFWAAYPNIVVDLSLSDEIVDLYMDRTDIAFRVGALQDSSLTSRKIGTTKRRIVASPAYLEKYGTPNTVEELAEHQCLGFNFRRIVPVWPVKDGSRRVAEKTARNILLANNGETVRRMALAGCGVARLGEYHIWDELKSGHLIEVLEHAGGRDEEIIHALYLGGPRVPHRIRAFLDFSIPRLQSFINRS